MIVLIMEWCRQRGLKVPLVFEYVSTRMLLAALFALLLSIFLGPFFINKLYEWKVGDTVRLQDCPLLKQLHEKKKDTPTMGGLLILSCMVISLLLCMKLKNSFTFLLLFITLAVGFIGFYDDLLKLKYKNHKGLSGKKKLFFQSLSSLFVALYLLCPPLTESLHVKDWFIPPVAKELTTAKPGAEQARAATLSTQQLARQIYIPFIKRPLVVTSGLGLALLGFWYIFVITGTSNAVNLTDGLDGLASGCLIMAASCLAFLAFVSNNVDLARYLNIPYIEGSGEIGIYLCALAGSCLGFLWFNGYPAQVFMGDTGSLALGAVMGTSAILLRREILFAIVGGVFVAEALSVILQVTSYRLRNKRRIFLCAPLHHHFEYMGWAENKVVMRFWIVSLILAILGIFSLKFQ